MMNQTDTPLKSAYQFTFHGIGGEQIPLADFQGKALLVVNTASECGFTPQYQGLESLWESMKEKGLVVLGVPSNDFGGQEPGGNDEIKAFCDLKYRVTFPMCEKTKVAGKDAHPFYKWVADQVGFVGKPRWNFYKYIIDREGKLLDWYSSITHPQADKLVDTVNRALG